MVVPYIHEKLQNICKTNANRQIRAVFIPEGDSFTGTLYRMLDTSEIKVKPNVFYLLNNK